MGHDDAGSTFGLDDLSFDNYCIVCDRLIDHPVEPEVVPSKTTKKKAAAGTIRVSLTPLHASDHIVLLVDVSFASPQQSARLTRVSGQEP